MKISAVTLVFLSALSGVTAQWHSACCNLACDVEDDPDCVPDDCSRLEDEEDYTGRCTNGESNSVLIGNLGRRMCGNPNDDNDPVMDDYTWCRLPSEKIDCNLECEAEEDGVTSFKNFTKRRRQVYNPDGSPRNDACNSIYNRFECHTETCTIDCINDGPQGQMSASADVTGIRRIPNEQRPWNQAQIDKFCRRVTRKELSRQCGKVLRTYKCCERDSDCLDPCNQCWTATGEAWQHKSHKGFCWDTKPKYYGTEIGGELAPRKSAPHRSLMCQDPLVCGDPHFRTWGGKWYDYHGECDLVLAKDASFEEKKGLDIHIRTKARQAMSYIESAAIKIGDDLLFEVTAFGEYVLNGVEEADFAQAFPKDSVWNMNHTMINKKEHQYDIMKNGHIAFHIKTFKDIVSVEIRIRLPESQGLLGDYVNGEMLTRDGETILNDPNEFGQEWQVNPSVDPTIFKTSRYPQFPMQCVMPHAKIDHRKLGELNGISEEIAMEACSHWGNQKHMCTSDVMRVGDLDLAAQGPF